LIEILVSTQDKAHVVAVPSIPIEHLCNSRVQLRVDLLAYSVEEDAGRPRTICVDMHTSLVDVPHQLVGGDAVRGFEYESSMSDGKLIARMPFDVLENTLAGAHLTEKGTVRKLPKLNALVEGCVLLPIASEALQASHVIKCAFGGCGKERKVKTLYDHIAIDHCISVWDEAMRVDDYDEAKLGVWADTCGFCGGSITVCSLRVTEDGSIVSTCIHGVTGKQLSKTPNRPVQCKYCVAHVFRYSMAAHLHLAHRRRYTTLPTQASMEIDSKQVQSQRENARIRERGIRSPASAMPMSGRKRKRAAGSSGQVAKVARHRAGEDVTSARKAAESSAPSEAESTAAPQASPLVRIDVMIKEWATVLGTGPYEALMETLWSHVREGRGGQFDLVKRNIGDMLKGCITKLKTERQRILDEISSNAPEDLDIDVGLRLGAPAVHELDALIKAHEMQQAIVSTRTLLQWQESLLNAGGRGRRRGGGAGTW